MQAQVDQVQTTLQRAQADLWQSQLTFAMMEIGQGSKIAIQKTIANMGANNLMVQLGAATSSV